MNLPDLLDEFENLEGTPKDPSPGFSPNLINSQVDSPMDTKISDTKISDRRSLQKITDKKKMFSQVFSSRVNKLKFENDSKRSFVNSQAQTVNSNFMSSIRHQPGPNSNSDDKMDDSDIYDALFDLINQGIVIIDINMRILFSN